MKNILTALILLIALSSCSSYYKAVLAPQPVNANTITGLKKDNRFFILRNGGQAYAMTNVSMSSDQKNVQCNLEPLPFEHQLHLTKGEGGRMRYNNAGDMKDNQTAVLNEVHLYIPADSNITAGPYTLTLDKVNKTEVIEADRVRTERSHTLGVILGISLPIVAVGGIIALAISSGLSTLPQ